MTQNQSPAQNPLLADWTGAFGLPPFATLLPEHFRPAFDQALGRHRAELDAIAANPERPTFDNTIVALEKSGHDLDRVANVFFVMAGADTGEAIEAVERDMSPLLARHSQRHVSRPQALCPYRRPLRPPRAARAERRAGARARPLPHPLRSRRRRAGPGGAGPPRRHQRAPRHARHPVRPERAGRREEPTRSSSTRPISPACRTSLAPPPRRQRRNAATRANTPSRWRARRAKASCNSRRGAICARKCSRPGSSAAKTAARPTTAR